MKMKLAMVALAFLAVAPGAQAEVRTYRGAGLQFEVPADWEATSDGSTLVAESPDGQASVTFEVIEEESIEPWRDQWIASLGPELTDLQIDVDAETSTVNGLEQVYSAGHATLKGEPIQWDLALVKGAHKVLAVMAFGEDLDGTTLQEVYESIRPLPTPAKDPTGRGALDDGYVLEGAEPLG